MERSTQERHKHLLTPESGETEDQMWARAFQFTNNCCFDEREKYALIKKSGGRKCGPGRDCDKVIEREAPHRIYDLVRNAGAFRAEPIFEHAHNHDGTPALGRLKDFAEPVEYEGAGEPQEPEQPEQPSPANPGPAPVPAGTIPDRGEMIGALAHLHQLYKHELKRPDGIWINGQPDFEGIGTWLFDVYFRARMAGKTTDEARAEFTYHIRHSKEWADNNPGQRP